MRQQSRNKITVIIHTENQDKLKKLLKVIEDFRGVEYFSLNLNSKGYIPWNKAWVGHQKPYTARRLPEFP